MSPNDPHIASPSSIPLYLINGVGTVWDAQVAATLHCAHGISGLRVGTLPGVASQNGFLGLPLTLMQEETAYLVRQGIAHLVPVNPNPTRCLPSPAEVDKYNTARVSRIRAQEAALMAQEEEKARRANSKFAQAGQVAQAKREARARARAEKTAAKGETMFEPEEKAKVEHPPVSAPATTDTHHFHAIQPHPAFPHLAHQAPITVLPDPLFSFPSTIRDRALLATFTRLLQSGLRVGLGPRFGGEYLIYPGDYLRYHAHFTSQVLVRDEVIRPAEIVAWGRLRTGTKKAGLLCCWDDTEGDGDGVGFTAWNGPILGRMHGYPHTGNLWRLTEDRSRGMPGDRGKSDQRRVTGEDVFLLSSAVPGIAANRRVQKTWSGSSLIR